MATPRKMTPPGRYVGRPGYGDPDAERRALAVRWALAVLFGLGLAYLVYGFVERSQSPYDAQIVRVVYGEAEVTVSWTVTKPEGEPAVCVLRSRSQAGFEIGRAEVPVAASVGSDEVQEFTLTTTDVPASGEVLGCGPPGRPGV